MQTKSMADQKPIRFVTDERLDFEQATPLRKSYVIGSSYRCGSTYLCWQLWNTGVLGAPTEVLNANIELRILMNRFKVSLPADYIAKLLSRRTSRNGIFGMKAHFHHFESFMNDYPALLDVLSPVSYIYINRRDKVAQAVSMAKALQTNWWSSRWEEGPSPPLHYDRDLIVKCMKEVELQDAGWLRWYDAKKIAPHEVIYEDLTADTPGTVRAIVELLGAQDDEPSEVHVPPAEKQSDDTNYEWIARFRQETQAAQERGGTEADGAEKPATGGHLFDRYDGLIKSLPEGPNSATGFIDVIRLRRRYDAIVGQNRALFQDARVLDIMSAHGFWSLAALDAGASHVVGIDAAQKSVDAAGKSFTGLSIPAESYRFIRSEIFAALKTFEPGQFDVIVCREFFELCHFSLFFHHLSRLRPKHVLLDTKVVTGQGPLARFSIATGRNRAILSIPSHELITLLCEADFKWRLIDWQAMGITDWTGIQDYARDDHRTYVLDRLP